MNCIFCRIAQNQNFAHEVFRNDRTVVFMDTSPIRPGHMQIIPVEHYEYFEDLPQDVAIEITNLAQKLAKILKELFEVERVGFVVTGGDIAHAHAHIVPLVEKDDITSRQYILEEDLTYRDPPYPGDEVLLRIAETIAQKF